MLFHITSKLQKKLHVPLVIPFPIDNGSFQGWYANIFRANRIQYILTTHATSLYSVVIPGKGVNSGTAYNAAFQNALRDQLQWHGLPDVYGTHIAPYAATATFAKTADRSVLSSMNSMVEQIISTLEFLDPSLSPPELGIHISEVPRKSLGYRLPVEALAMLLCERFTTP